MPLYASVSQRAWPKNEPNFAKVKAVAKVIHLVTIVFLVCEDLFFHEHLSEVLSQYNDSDCSDEEPGMTGIPV